jgi:hypothetical protein
MEGSAEYGSGSIDEITGDMVTRDAVAFNKLPSLEELQGFGHLKPNQVTLGYKTGEAAMHFLKDEYGIEPAAAAVAVAAPAAGGEAGAEAAAEKAEYDVVRLLPKQLDQLAVLQISLGQLPCSKIPFKNFRES